MALTKSSSSKESAWEDHKERKKHWVVVLASVENERWVLENAVRHGK